MGNGPKVGQNRDRLIKEAQQQMGFQGIASIYVLRAGQLASLACALPLFLFDNTSGCTDANPALY